MYKSCAQEYEPTQCKQSGFGSKLITRCTCESKFCNGDVHLDAAGLQPLNSALARLPRHGLLLGQLLAILVVLGRG